LSRTAKPQGGIAKGQLRPQDALDLAIRIHSGAQQRRHLEYHLKK